MAAVDAYVPLPARAIDQPFLMPIEDIFSISGRGTVVTGRIERGQVKVGEEVEIVGFRETRKTVVTGVEMFKKQLDAGMAGDAVSVGASAAARGRGRQRLRGPNGRIRSAVAPNDIIEEIWARDVLDLLWETLRLRRLKAKLMRAAAHERLDELLRPLTGIFGASGSEQRLGPS